MSTEQLLLSAVGSPDQWTLGAGSTKVVACQTPDDDGTSYINSGTSSGVIQMFTLADPVNIGSGDTINSVALRIRFNRNGTPAAYLRGRLVTSGGTLNGTTVQASNGYVNRSDTFTEKPDGGAWTLSALNELTAGVEMTSGSQDLICTTIEVIVDYTPGAVETEETAQADRVETVGAAPDLEIGAAAAANKVAEIDIAGSWVVQDEIDLARVDTTAIADNAEVSDAVALARRVTTAVYTDIPGIEEAVSIDRIQIIAGVEDVALPGAISVDRVHAVTSANDAVLGDAISITRSLAVAAGGQTEIGDQATISRTHAITIASETGGDIEASITLARSHTISNNDDVVLTDGAIDLSCDLGIAAADTIDTENAIEVERRHTISGETEIPGVEESISLTSQHAITNAIDVVLTDSAIDLSYKLGLEAADTSVLFSAVTVARIYRIAVSAVGGSGGEVPEIVDISENRGHIRSLCVRIISYRFSD